MDDLTNRLLAFPMIPRELRTEAVVRIRQLEQAVSDARDLIRRRDDRIAELENYEAVLRDVAQDCWHHADDRYPCCRAKRALRHSR